MVFKRLFLVLALLSGCGAREPAAIQLQPPSSQPAQVTPVAAVPPRVFLNPDGARLNTALEAYRTIAARGGWAPVPAGESLKLGSQGGRVVALRQRLSVSGDLGASADRPEIFDIQLAAAVRAFQAHHGLEQDGVVGAQTLKALNVPVESRIATMELNLARMSAEGWRSSARYVAVNVAAASYRLVEYGMDVMAGPTVVGRPDWQTPRIDSVINRLEFHPYWTIPSRIAAREVWPKAHRDPGYLRRSHMHVVNGQIRQDPGPDNPLGKVKFLFPNSYSVYLHDTNHPEFFADARRFRSHGCVRVSHALDLARTLLRDDPEWPPSRIDEALAAGRNVKVRLAHPIPVHLVYVTAWVDEDGSVQFREDVYGRDHFGPDTRLAPPQPVKELYGG